MKVYHYEEQNGVYLGEGEARPDPMEPGRYLIPAWATTIEPPDEIEGKARAFDGTGWVHVDIVQEA